FFLQAEDGIRDFHVTGVQTCALPILRFSHACGAWRHPEHGAMPGHGRSSRYCCRHVFGVEARCRQPRDQRPAGPTARKPGLSWRGPHTTRIIVMSFSASSFNPLWLSVAKPLRRRIVEGEILPGQPLSENLLATEFGVSRTPVRE